MGIKDSLNGAGIESLCAKWAYFCKHHLDKMRQLIYTFLYILMKDYKMKKTAKVFKNGNSQAIRLPKEYRVATSEVFIEKQNNSIIITQK